MQVTITIDGPRDERQHAIDSALSKIAPEGSGLNSSLQAAANLLRHHVEPWEATSLVLARAREQSSPSRWSRLPSEVRRAVDRAYNRNTHHDAGRAPVAQWPAFDPEAVDLLLPASVYDLWEKSPIRLPNENCTNFVLEALFGRGALLCVGRCKEHSAVIGLTPKVDLKGYQFVVPNIPVKTHGLNQDGRRSTRCLEMFDTRNYLVLESDRLDKDRQATVLLHFIRQGWPIRLVVDSGGKSLQAWLDCRGQTEEWVMAKLRSAVRLGADPAAKNKCQFFRMPDGRRDNGMQQTILYFGTSKKEIRDETK